MDENVDVTGQDDNNDDDDDDAGDDTSYTMSDEGDNHDRDNRNRNTASTATTPVHRQRRGHWQRFLSSGRGQEKK